MIELNGIQLDKTSAVPLYEQLRKALLEAITSGKLSAGTKLPTEEELCAQFGISRNDSSSVGSLFTSRRAFVHITIPGIQNPH